MRSVCSRGNVPGCSGEVLRHPRLDGRHDVTGRPEAGRRPRPWPGRSLLPRSDGLERGRGARGRRRLRGAATHAEGANRRADDRVAPFAGRLPSADRAGGGEAARARAPPRALRREVRDRARGAPLDPRAGRDRARRRPVRARPPERRLRRAGGSSSSTRSRRRMRRRLERTSSSAFGSSRGRHGWVASSTTA